MSLREIAGRAYRWGLHKLLYNDTWSSLFFSTGFKKKINDIEIMMPFKYSWFYPSTYEKDKTEFIKSNCNAGDTVIDIGAHMGIFSFFLAKQVGPTGKVYSFEPSPETFSVLKQTLVYNKLTSIVEARNEAVSDTKGPLSFYVYDSSAISNANSISILNLDAKTSKITVKATSLDHLYNEEKIERLTLIKIDAEGAELSILKGGKRLISSFRPLITLEVHPKSFENAPATMKNLYTLIKEYRYNVYEDKLALSEKEFCAHSRFFEVLLIPE